ncbi:MAG: CoA transferase [Gemmatimonadota bacterium]|nr:CoA transferase [Gemmatimonadota bacterium]
MQEGHQHPPLAGMRIVSVEQFGAGPWGTMMLADLGAEIIKVENPGTRGDVARYVPPYTTDRDSLYFQSFNRNKKSITLNLRNSGSGEVLHRLVTVSDGVFNNLRGDLPARLGLDYPSLSEVKASIVCCSLSAFGRTGPRADEPGYDYLMQGYAGWMSLTGEPDGPPTKTGLSLVDLGAGAMASLGMASAIFRARRTGLGCDVDVNLFDTALAHLGYVGAWYLTGGYEANRMPDSSHPSQIPSQVVPTKDGWLVVMCAKEKFFQNLAGILGTPELAEDPRFRSFADRLENREVLVPILKERFRERTTADWLALLRGKVPCAPVNTVAQAFADPHVDENDMILELPHPEFGTARVVASPIKVAGPSVEPRRGPSLGEHNEPILRDLLGYSTAEIEDLRGDGVI